MLLLKFWFKNFWLLESDCYMGIVFEKIMQETVILFAFNIVMMKPNTSINQFGIFVKPEKLAHKTLRKTYTDN